MKVSLKMKVFKKMSKNKIISENLTGTTALFWTPRIRTLMLLYIQQT